jgi:hypothetical protein
MRRAGASLAFAVLVFIWLSTPDRGGAAQAAADLSGRWMMAQLSTTVARVPVIGDVYARSRLVALLNLTHEGDRLHGKGVLCRLDIDSGSRLVSTTLPAAFLRSLPRPFVDARLVHDADGPLRFEQARQTVVVGAHLPVPERDPLPRGPDDPRVYDQDGDGHPGVTIEIGGIINGEIYVTQRSWTALSGTASGPEGFSGSLRFGNEQVVLDATSHMLADPPVSRPVPSQSWFRLVRLPKSTPCLAAARLASAWFQ